LIVKTGVTRKTAPTITAAVIQAGLRRPWSKNLIPDVGVVL